MYTLTHIIDHHSLLKSIAAKELIKRVLSGLIPDLQYIDGFSEMDPHADIQNCQNDVYLPDKREICHVKVKDKFVLAPYPEGRALVIGNHCIGNFVEHNAISNVTPELLAEIRELMTIKNVCIVCGKSCQSKQLMHATCRKRKEKLNTEIQLRHKVKIFSLLLANNDTLRKINRNRTFTNKDVNLVNDLVESYPDLYENAERLSALYNNCIIKSIKMRRRLPSDKQLVVLKRIIDDYDFIKHLDWENRNPKYIQYGFVFKSQGRWNK